MIRFSPSSVFYSFKKSVNMFLSGASPLPGFVNWACLKGFASLWSKYMWVLFPGRYCDPFPCHLWVVSARLPHLQPLLFSGGNSVSPEIAVKDIWWRYVMNGMKLTVKTDLFLSLSKLTKGWEVRAGLLNLGALDILGWIIGGGGGLVCVLCVCAHVCFCFLRIVGCWTAFLASIH